MAYDKIITLKFTGYKVYGTATLLLWGGGTGEIEMDPFCVDNLEDETLRQKINDGGFGCERILSAECRIFEDYQGYELFYGDKFVALSEVD